MINTNDFKKDNMPLKTILYLITADCILLTIFNNAYQLNINLSFDYYALLFSNNILLFIIFLMAKFIILYFVNVLINLKLIEIKIIDDILMISSLPYHKLVLFLIGSATLEEIIFRVVVFRGGLIIGYDYIFCLVLSSLMFGMMHSNNATKGKYVYVIVTAISGVMYCIAYTLTDSIVFIIMLHFSYNLISFIIGKTRSDTYINEIELIPDEEWIDNS